MKKNNVCRVKEYNPDQILLITMNPMIQFPEGSYERFIVDIIKELDVSEFYPQKEIDAGGREQYNPKSLLSIIFYAYSDGVFSSRRMSMLCEKDLRYIFISGDNTPDHSTISRFINKYQSEIQKTFTQILYIADKMNYVDYKIIATDGSKIRANASSNFTGTLEDFGKKSKKLEEKIILSINKQKETDKNEMQEYWKKKGKKI